MGLRDFIRNSAESLGVLPSRTNGDTMAEDNIAYTPAVPPAQGPAPNQDYTGWTDAPSLNSSTDLRVITTENNSFMNVTESIQSAPRNEDVLRDTIDEWELNYNLGCAYMHLYRAAHHEDCTDLKIAMDCLQRELDRRRAKASGTCTTTTGGFA